MDTPCIVFDGYIGPTGYGQYWLNGTTVRAHRQAWINANGPIPDGLSVLHKCDNKPCINLEHLYLGTEYQNACDRIERGLQTYPIGATNGSAKLTDEAVVAMRRMHMEGIRNCDLAEMFNVSRPTVSDIVHRKLWAHVP